MFPAPQDTWSDPPPPAPRRRHGVAVVVQLVVAAVVAALAIVAGWTPSASGEAHEFVGSDGQAVLVADGSASASIETAHFRGPHSWLRAPLVFGIAAYADPADTEWIRESRVGEDPDLAGRSLFRVTADGLALAARVDAGGGYAFDPAPLVVPVDVSGPREWTVEGTATDAASAAYRYRLTQNLTPAADGCLRLETALRVGSEERRFGELRCRGRGPVEITVEGRTLGPAGPEVRERLAERVRPGAWPVRWSAPENWVESRWQVRSDGREMTGLWQLAALPDGPVMGDRDGDLVFCRPDAEDGTCEMDWNARPGGALITFTTVGNVLVAASAQRSVTAWLDSGQRLWHLDTDDLVTGIVRSGPETLLITTLGGSVSFVDLRTGEAVTTVGLDDPVSAPAAVGERVIAVVDESGHAEALEPTGELRWRRTVDGSDSRVAVTGDTVALLSGSGFLTGRTAAGGDALWHARVAESGVELIALGDRILVCHRSAVLARDARTGSVDWAVPGGLRHRTDGVRLLVEHSDRFEVFDESGRSLGTLPLGAEGQRLEGWPMSVGERGLLTLSNTVEGRPNELVLFAPPGVWA
ncbi:PQQ-binding-like beta-propeller repeat protein [Ammonicoccus fulvus]|uniref:PQQ-binding-like beta-propeller repeat protein n=1 Tax=Ammonicoccus fulvus TaxID=3138240 RepID=A0ABZ3FQQ0_9ACTN